MLNSNAMSTGPELTTDKETPNAEELLDALSQARREAELLRRQLQDRGAFVEMVGNSESIRQIYSLVEQVAPSSASVLITGESGTGKEWWPAPFTTQPSPRSTFCRH